jgi:hypothetical protein
LVLYRRNPWFRCRNEDKRTIMRITAPSNLLIVALWALLPAALIGVPPNVAAQDVAPHNDAITAARLRADLMFLAGDGFRGRLTNTPENALALE